jgi:hypothetical protein
MAYLVIDGQLDYRYIEIYNTGYYLRDHFISSDKSMKYFFKFNNTIRSNNNNNNNENQIKIKTKYGGIGAISIYFYRARPINEICDDMPNFEIKQPILSNNEIINTNDINITSCFDMISNPLGPMMPNMNFLKSLYDFPIGVLHLHYRNTFWFNTLQINSLNDGQYDNKIPIVIDDGNGGNDGYGSNGGNMMALVKQENGHVGHVSIKKELQQRCDEFVTIKQEPQQKSKQEYEDKKSIIVKQEPDRQDFGSFSVENKLYLNHSLDNNIFNEVKQEIKEESNDISTKVEPVGIITNTDIKLVKNIKKSNDFEIHKNKNGGGIKKKNKKDLKNVCRPINSNLLAKKGY